MKIKYISSVYLLVLLVITGCSQVAVSDTGLETLTIRKSGGQEITFHIEVADTDVLRRKGLMFRKSMPADQGMLLDFKRDFRVSIWMKNTFIPLDLIYINAQGTIVHIHRGAVPFSTETISGGNKVRAVLEINAGQVEEHGINIGDRVIYSSFKN